jgi:hypothetical protein
MAKKKSTRRKPASPLESTRPAVTTERFTRLFRLVKLLSEGRRTRDQLTRPLSLDVRGFYRDLELLRTVEIVVEFTEGQYTLGEPFAQAIGRLPYPDPHLSLGEMQQLARGKSKLHQALQSQIEQLLS